MNRIKRTKRAKLIRKLDKLFSLYVRERDNFTCVRCHKRHYNNSMGLHCSHYYGRSRISVRFDLRNGDALCFPCHKRWEQDEREAYREFKIKQLGQAGYDALHEKSLQTKTPTFELEEILEDFQSNTIRSSKAMSDTSS